MRIVVAVFAALVAVLVRPAPIPVAWAKSEARAMAAHDGAQAVRETDGPQAASRAPSRAPCPLAVPPVAPKLTRFAHSVARPGFVLLEAANAPGCRGHADGREAVRRMRVAAHIPRMDDDDPPGA